MMTNEELRQALLAQPKNGYAELTEAQREEMETYISEYRSFLDACKTEREATAWTVAEAEAHGFKALTPDLILKPGDKVYYVNRNKSVLLAVMGRQSLAAVINSGTAYITGGAFRGKAMFFFQSIQHA